MYLHVLFYPILFHFKACTILLTDVSPNKFNSKKEIKKKETERKQEKKMWMQEVWQNLETNWTERMKKIDVDCFND